MSNNKFTQIGELLHTSIASSRKAMDALIAKGDNAFNTPSAELDAVKEIITKQIDTGADYIEINLDDLLGNNDQEIIEMMAQYVELIKQCCKDNPECSVCIDSSDDRLLVSGLNQWYKDSHNLKKPMINSVKVSNIDNILSLGKEKPFRFIALLMSEMPPENAKQAIDELLDQANKIFDAAMDYGFSPDDIFFDTGVYPLAIDIPMNPGQPGYTYRTFETVKAILADEKFKGVHFSLGFSNCFRDLPRRKIGITRAYVHKAIEIGVDGGIVNTTHSLHSGEAAPELLALVEAFAQLDGDMEKTTTAMELMASFCSG